MIEIRPIRPSEAETFLRLMCSEFDLDLGRARSVFYAEPYYDLNHKWALFDGIRMASIMTTTPLRFGWGEALGVAGVATARDLRRQGYARRLLESVLDPARPALLFARDERLYQSLGFGTADHVITGELHTQDGWEEQPVIESGEVRRIYDDWAQRDPRRLIRDDQRWKLWLWNYRVCARYQDGYLASEPEALREALFTGRAHRLTAPQGTEWYGLRKMADLLGLPLRSSRNDMFLMTRSVPAPPLMFMTDQF